MGSLLDVTTVDEPGVVRGVLLYVVLVFQVYVGCAQVIVVRVMVVVENVDEEVERLALYVCPTEVDRETDT